MAWTRKVLRVDLNKGTCASEPLNMEWAKKYLGQRKRRHRQQQKIEAIDQIHTTERKSGEP